MFKIVLLLLLAVGLTILLVFYLFKKFKCTVSSAPPDEQGPRTRSDDGRQSRTGSGRELNERWGVGARQSRYHMEGTFFEILTKFPGALFDLHGYILFPREEDYLNCEGVFVTQKTNVPNGISKLPGYKQVIDAELKRLADQENRVVNDLQQGANPYLIPQSAGQEIRRCRHCGNPAMPGDDECYSCSSF